MKSTLLMHKPETAEALRRILEDIDVECDIVSGSLAQFTTGNFVVRDLLVAETDGGAADLGLVERIASQYPQLPIILAAADPSKEFLLKAMRLGVREVLPLPVKAESVREVILHLRQRLAPVPGRQGKVIVFQPSKGGSGATFLAANFAHVLAQGGSRVALIDLNLQFGDAALHLSDQKGSASIADVALNIQRLDREYLVSSMLRVNPGLAVLPSPDAPDGAAVVRPEVVQRTLEVARECFDYVVVDIERHLNPVSIRALDCADIIVAVVQLTLPFIRDAKRLLSVFDSLGYPRSKIRLVVNRYQKGGDISLADVEATLGLDVAYTIPNSFNAVAASVNQGMPIFKLDPTDRVSKALADMARQMGQRSDTPAGGWLSRLFRKTAA